MSLLALASVFFYLLATGLTVRWCIKNDTTSGKVLFLPASIAMFIHVLTLMFSVQQGDPIQNLSVLNIASAITLLINVLLTSISHRQNSWVLLPITYSCAILVILFNSMLPHHYLTDLADRPGLVVHIVLALLAYSLMSIASLFALLQLYLNHQLKLKKKVQLNNMPPLLRIESVLIRLLQSGLLLLTLSILSGFLFLENLFAPNNIDKAGVSIIAWVLYSILLWGHYRNGWRGQRLVTLTLLGNVLLAVAYFGSRLILSYF